MGMYLILGSLMVVAMTTTSITVQLRRRLLVVTVTGSSMEPTFRAGDRVLARRAPAAVIKPGQVVVLTNTAIPQNHSHPTGGGIPLFMIKRLVALPGDPVPKELGNVGILRSSSVVPPGNIVVLGDNVTVSVDSRQIGYLAAERVIG